MRADVVKLPVAMIVNVPLKMLSLWLRQQTQSTSTAIVCWVRSAVQYSGRTDVVERIFPETCASLIALSM